MPSKTDILSFAADFPPTTYDSWRKLVDGVLKGAAFEKLIGTTADGLKIDPIYPRARDAAAIAGRAAARPWQIMQQIDHTDPAEANAQALLDLENGADGLTLVFADAIGAHGFGLAPTEAALARVLDGVFLDAGIGIELRTGPQSRKVAFALAERVRRNGIDPAVCSIRFGFDPIGAAAASGSSPDTRADAALSFTSDVKRLADLGYTKHAAVADGRVIHDAGGSEAQELAFVLATGIAYLRALEGAGMGLDEARGTISARLAADADQFMTMAKFRALRLLWARVEAGCGLGPKPLFIAADTAWRMLTQRDADVNMLRATVAVFAAGLGGVDSVTVLPHTRALGLPDAFARRVARNTQLILQDESNLTKVSDPAAGSGGIESLTQQLCQTAWIQFQEIEHAGGILAALEQNRIQAKVSTVRTARAADIAKRKNLLTGVSEFPNLHEKKPAVLPAKPAAPGSNGKPNVRFEPLSPIRLAAPFEQLRDRSDNILEKTGTRPRVLLANLGKPSDFTARATFAKSLFEAGGIEAIDTDGALAPEALAEMFKASGAMLACLCSSDAVYADHAAAAAKALQAAGGRHIYLAGRPGDKEAEFLAAGVGAFAFAGSDAIAMLNAAYSQMD